MTHNKPQTKGETMNARINREFDRFTRQFKYILRCSGVLNGTIMGDDINEAARSLHEINIRRESKGLEIITVA